ncbi:MAG: carboxylating nicotinate-nucleotide diphosphorylase [Planctomycetota bacterium]|nr:carboxylating nicotinate-nucleotide diphosphorylase [Planctomycetota bacterium]
MPPVDLNTLPLPALFEELATLGRLGRFLELVREEDLGPDGLDVTSLLAVGASEQLRAEVRVREAGVVAGLATLEPIVEAFGADVGVELHTADGEHVERGRSVAVIEGSARDVLAVERPMLNLLGRLSGVATRTAAFVEAMGEGWPAKLFDTRKTTPGLRHLEKYAVRCGGGCCHRLGLHDAVLVKDNHIAAMGSGSWAERVGTMAAAARARFGEHLRFIEVEVDGLAQFERLLALDMGRPAVGVPAVGVIDVVLLDNMPVADMRQAVTMRDAQQPALQLEASGGVTLETVRDVASSGVDRISVGSLTHHAVSLDFGLDAV